MAQSARVGGGGGLSQASRSVIGTELSVAFVGAPEAGDNPPGEDYSAGAAECDLAVMVIIIGHPHVTVGGCSLVGTPRTATATLAAPFGERPCRTSQQGTPVPVVLAP